MTDTIDVAALVERLRADAAQLRKMQENARFGGDHTHVRVANPEFLLGDLTEAATALQSQAAALAEARREIERLTRHIGPQLTIEQVPASQRTAQDD